MPPKDNKAQHGGARFHPPGREYGRPRNLHPLWIIKIACTEEEYREILKFGTRWRARALLREIKEEKEANQGTKI